jgi:hypothetical protein
MQFVRLYNLCSALINTCCITITLMLTGNAVEVKKTTPKDQTLEVYTIEDAGKHFNHLHLSVTVL